MLKDGILTSKLLEIDACLVCCLLGCVSHIQRSET